MNEESKPLPFDIKILLTTLKLKLKWIVLFSIIGLVFSIWFSLKFLKNQWTATTIVVKHSKNLRINTSVPYLYQDFDPKTILATIKLRKNLLEIKKRLNLDISERAIANSIAVKRGRKSAIVRISATNENIKKSMSMADTSSEVFIDHYIELQNSKAHKTIIALKKQKLQALSNISEFEKAISDFKKKRHILDVTSEKDLKYSQLREIELAKIELKLQIDETKLNIAENKKKILMLPNAKEIELENLLKRYTQDNPKVKKLQHELSQNKKDSNTLIGQISGNNSYRDTLIIETLNLQSTLKNSNKKIIGYEQKMYTLKKELKTLITFEKEFLKLQSKLSFANAALERIEQGIMQAKNYIESNISDFEVIQYAATPLWPAKSMKKTAVVGITILFFLLSLLYFLGKELTNFSVKSSNDFISISNVDYITQIPVKQDSTDGQFYNRLQVLFSYINNTITKNTKSNIVTFLSPDPAVGKSFIIDEVCEMLSLQQLKTLKIISTKTVDDDLKNSTINKILYSTKTDTSFNPQSINSFQDEIYFEVEPELIKKIFNKDGIASFAAQLQSYDIVLWELFPSKLDIQKVATLCELSNLSIIVTDFKKTKLSDIKEISTFFENREISNTFSLINNVKKHYLEPLV